MMMQGVGPAAGSVAAPDAAVRVLLVTGETVTAIVFDDWQPAVARSVIGDGATVVPTDDCLLYAVPTASGAVNGVATRMARWAGWDDPAADALRGPVIFTGRTPDGAPCSVPEWLGDSALHATLLERHATRGWATGI